MTETAPMVIAGAGLAAAELVRRGVPVTVLEAKPALPLELRGSSFHASTLGMPDNLGAKEAARFRDIVRVSGAAAD